jgi:CRP-like cAMP-binding protein
MPPELVHTYGLHGTTGGDEAGTSQQEEESHPHPSFGELALLYSKPRAATVVARTDGVLWSLHRNDYKVSVMMQAGAWTSQIHDTMQADVVMC